MKTALGLMCFLAVLGSASARADVTLEVMNAEKGVFRVTYEVTDETANAESFILPSALDTRDQRMGSRYWGTFTQMKIEKITERNTGQDLIGEIVETRADGQIHRQIRVRYVNPIPRGGHYKLSITFIAASPELCYRDNDGRVVLKYATSHDTFVILPLNHAPIYSSVPVLIYEKNRRTVLQAKDLKEREKGASPGLLVKMHPYAAAR
jgi:hypothetical protein